MSSSFSLGLSLPSALTRLNIKDVSRITSIHTISYHVCMSGVFDMWDVFDKCSDDSTA